VVKKTTTYFFILQAIFCCLASFGQQLPFTGNNICLDAMQTVASFPIKAAKNMVVKDFNNDGLKDVAIADINTNNLYVYKNNNPGFSISYSLNLPGLGVFNSIDAGDFNSDFQNDIILCYGGNIKILTNNNLFFTLGTTIPIQSNYKLTPTYIKAENLDGDFNLDFVVTGSHLNPNHGVAVFAYRNTSPATLSFSLDYSNLIFYGSPSLDTTKTVDLSIADIDGVNGPDLLYTYGEKQDTMVFLQKTGSSVLGYTEQRRGLFPFPTIGYQLNLCETADLDSDSKFDYVIVHSSTGGPKVNFYLGDGNFTNSPVQTFQLSLPVSDFKLSDVNTDGYQDFIGINTNGLVIYLYDVVNNKFKENSPINIAIPANFNLTEMNIADYDGNFFYDLCLKSSNGLDAKPVIIPNFAHYVFVTNTNSLICPGVSATMTANSSVTLTGLSHNYAWYFFGSPLPYSTNQTVVTNSLGIHYVTLSHAVPFTAGFTCNYTGFPEYIAAAPVPTVNITVFQPSLCLGSYAYFNANGAQTYTWLPSMTTNPSYSIQASLTNNTVSVLGMDTNGCIDTAVAGVNIFPPYNGEIKASKNPFCAGDSVSLRLDGAMSYTWSVPNINSSYLQFYPTANTNIMVDFQDAYGCMGSRNIQLDMNPECDIKIYSTITPNGDSNNDFWFIENINRFKDNHVIIYNRWGQEVYSTRNYDNANNKWPSEKSKSFSSGTYFYVLDLGNGTIKKGWIEIINS
jgi:gliding motility-associated-like protein